MRGLGSLPSNIAIDTGPLLLPVTREPGWDKIKELFAMHERGDLTLCLGLFNIIELIFAMHKLGYHMETSLRYSALIYEKFNVIRSLQYAVWMGKLRAKAYELNYAIPWGDISSAAVAIHMNIPVIVLDEDKHFNQVLTICDKLNLSLIHI